MKYICLALICIAVSLSSAAGFQRPWENATWLAENPNIYASTVWWNVPELSRSLDSLDLEATSHLDAKGLSRAYALAALQDKNDAENAFAACVARLSPGFWARLAVVSSGPVGLAAAALANFSLVPACRSYPELWKGAVGNSLSSLEAGMEAADDSIAGARAGYEEMKWLGLCNRNYTRAGSGPCAEMQSAFAAVDGNVAEGAYGKYVQALEYSGALRIELLRPAPSLASYGPAMVLLWGEGGAVPSFDVLSEEAEAACAGAETEYGSLLDAARARKKMAGEGLTSAVAQRLDLVSRAPAAYDAWQAGSVAERLAQCRARSVQLSNYLQEAELLHSNSLAEGHLANSINMMAGVGRDYASLIEEASALQEEARTAVAQQREEAEEELAATARFMERRARGTASVALQDEATSYFRKGDSAPTSGEKFDAYRRAAASAREARDGRSYAQEQESKALLGQLRALILSAKADGINVASEEAALALLERVGASDIRDAANASIAAIVAKARLRYDESLLGVRARLLDKLALAGPGAADLYTDLYRSEAGVVGSDGSIAYPDAIGRLKPLARDYDSIEATLDAYMGDIVGNCMSISASPLVEGVTLDEPATITLDAVLANSRNYAARNVTARVSMPAPVEFLYSDIISGRDKVSSLRMADGSRTVLLSFDSVGPFETRRVTLQKRVVVAHTLKKEVHAEGSGGGSAFVTATVDFTLDTGVKSISLPFADALIEGSAPGQLAPGKHTASAAYAVADAYEESRGDFRAYTVGTNSRMEYDIEVIPKMDLDSVLVFLDSLNDSNVSSLAVVAATGELVRDRKQVSMSEYSARVVGLKNGRPVVLKVSYLVSNTEAYVRSGISLLETRELGNESRSYLEEARGELAAGNYSLALELLEKSQAAARSEDAANAKLEKKCGELSQKLDAELGELGAALAANATDRFMERLSARKAELERVRSELEGLDPAQKAALLDKVDYGWMDGEISALRKDSYKEYNGLKERFFKAGNSSTPAEFLAFESALNRLETGGRLEYAVQLVQALQAVRSLVEIQEAGAAMAWELRRADLERLKSGVLDVQERYLREAGVAKGTEYAGFFTETSQTIAKKIKEAEDSLGGDGRVADIKAAELNRTRQKMLDALGELKSEAEAKLALVESLLARAELDSAERADLESKLQVMRGMLAGGEYVNALRAGTAIAKELDSTGKKDGNGLLLLGITALAILAVVAVYIIKQQDGGAWPGSKGSKKPLRRLQKTGEGPAQPPSPPDEAG